jgi:energy-coupling factor transport system permease protein
MVQSPPIMLGQYRPLDSFLHRIDARSKMLPILLVLILALVTESFLFYVIMLAALVLALFLSGIDGRSMWRNLKPLVWLVVVTSLYHLVFSGRDTSVLFSVFGWDLTEGAVRTAGFYSLRLILFVSIAFLVTLTSSPSDLAESIARILRPLERLRVPVHDLSMIVFIAIRFIPVLYGEFVAIKNAQIMRGVDFSGSLPSRIRKTTHVLIPVFLAAIQRADDLAMAIAAREGHLREDRSWRRRRTYYSRLRFGWPEYGFVLLASLLAVGAFQLSRLYG